MKLTSIETSNFIGARDVRVKLAKPVALFAGKNYSGKSSLQESIRMALVGESVRVELKKDYEQLITEGQDAGFVTVQWDGGEASVVLPSGKRSQSGDQLSSALPYVLDAQRFAKLSDNDRRSFLFGLMGVKLDGAAVKERLIARDCNLAKIDQIVPILRAGFDAGQKEAAAKARDAKSSWTALTGGDTWGKDKAAKWQPAALPADADKAGALHENAVVKMKEVERDLGVAQQALGAANAALQKRHQSASLRDDLVEKASRIDRIKAKLAKDEADVAEWSQKVDVTRAKAGASTGVPNDPGDLLRGLAGVTAQFLEITCEHPNMDWDTGLINRAATHLATFRDLHGEPTTSDEPVKPDTEAVANLPEYEKALALVQNSVANDKRDLSAAEQAASKLKEMDAEADKPIDTGALQAQVDDLTAKRDGWRADAEKYRSVADQAASRKTLIERTAAAHADVLAWTDIADALAPDGIPGEMLSQALGPINERLNTSGNDAEWPIATIHDDMRITYGLRDYAMLSESEKWRTDAMIAEAVSFISGVKLLALDRFDVLDMKGREDMLIWLDILAQDGEIDTAIICGTIKSLPAQLPNTIDAFWLENGVTGKLGKAA